MFDELDLLHYSSIIIIIMGFIKLIISIDNIVIGTSFIIVGILGMIMQSVITWGCNQEIIFDNQEEILKEIKKLKKGGKI